MIWQVPHMWEEGDVWILGGGPSVPVQFGIPDEVVQKVINGTSPASVYSPYMHSLHNKHVIGINVAYLIGNWIDIVFFGDVGFFLNHQQGLADFPSLKVTCHPRGDRYDWIKYLAKDTSHTKGISSNPKMVSWNGNSGAAAISLAVHTGAKRIILLGFDMKLNESNMQHWHNLYNKGERLNKKKLPFERHLRGFSAIAADAKRMGVEILNASPGSEIKEFPKYTVKELLFDNT
jgi:hypothetical protein